METTTNPKGSNSALTGHMDPAAMVTHHPTGD